MRKLKVAAAAALLTAFVFSSVFLFAGCTVSVPTVAETAEALGLPDLSGQAEIVSASGSGLPYTDSENGVLSVVFQGERQVNTVVLSEKSSSVEEFVIYAKVRGQFKKLYRQDFIRSLRYCVFPTVVTTELEIRFRTAGGEFTIRDLGIFDVPAREDGDFRVLSYLDVEIFQNIDDFDRGYGIEGLSSVTDVILTGGAEFRSDGTLDVSEKLNAAIENLKTAERLLNRRFTVYCNFRNSEKEFALGEFSSTSDQYFHAMKNNKKNFIASLRGFLYETGIDGAAFDWTYPRSNADWNAYSSFLSELRASLENGRKLTVALAGWSCGFNRAAIEAVDCFQVMSYDLPDSTGSHASFELTVKDAERLVARGIDRKKSYLGIPFYARETDGGEERWFPYRSEAENLGGDFNVISNPVILPNGTEYRNKRFYNGCTMVRDKTLYACDTGFGGVMFWEHKSDARYDAEINGKPISLIRAISDALDYRKS